MVRLNHWTRRKINLEEKTDKQQQHAVLDLIQGW